MIANICIIRAWMGLGSSPVKNWLPNSSGGPIHANNLIRRCLMGKIIDLTGQKFGRWTVISKARLDKYGSSMWLCQCECGTKEIVRRYDLRRGLTKSCGCLRKELLITHGMTNTTIYAVWKSMRRRCNKPNDPGYKNYGGRGITICRRWDKFENFYADMGDKPKGLSIERVDNYGNYEPSNCKWATREEQDRNKRNNRIIKYEGREQCLTDWARESGINYRTLCSRLNKYPPHIAFNI